MKSEQQQGSSSASLPLERVSEGAVLPSPAAHLADSIIYLSSLLSAGPRPIDRYIDYFGEAASFSAARRTGAAIHEAQLGTPGGGWRGIRTARRPVRVQ